MRLKHVKGAEEYVLDTPFVENEPEQYRGRWAAVFENDAPIHIEIGMGKGQFITALAQNNPQINYVGIEKFSSVLVRAIQKQELLQLPNLRLIRMDAEDIEQVFAPGEVDRIYLNFSDPWPKDRHAKRRLTSARFIARYRNIARPQAAVEFKTDNRPLFDFSVESAAQAGCETLYLTYDLHRSPEAADNIMTEYEEKFAAKGNPIGKLIFRL